MIFSRITDKSEPLWKGKNGLDRTFRGTVKLGYSTARLINQTHVIVQDMNQLIHHSHVFISMLRAALFGNRFCQFAFNPSPWSSGKPVGSQCAVPGEQYLAQGHYMTYSRGWESNY